MNDTAARALAWMEGLQRSGREVLFRGQSRVWPTIKASITRDCEGTRQRMWAIVRQFCAQGASHVTGYFIEDMHDRLSILQHYILRSPVIDLTATPKIALYFAIGHAKIGSHCVVYAVDKQEACRGDVVFSNHAFLASPIDRGGNKHRWLRQDAFSVGPRSWWDPQVVQEFDMLKLSGVTSFEFTRQAGDERLVEDCGDLESIDDDPLAFAVRGNFQGIAKRLDLWNDKLATIIERGASGDPDAALHSKLNQLSNWARKLDAKEELRILEELRWSLSRNLWDTGHTVGLLEVENRLRSRGDGAKKSAAPRGGGSSS